MLVKTFEQFIAEGINDPNILKAVFLAGGPGSGKSYAAKRIFGIDDNISSRTSMVFVNTSLPVAQERNQMRDRTLPTKMVEEMWNQVQQNIGKFQSLFKNSMVIVDNSETGDFGKMHGEKIKVIEKLIKKPVSNPTGKAWMKSQRV